MKTEKIQVLLVEDNPTDALVVQEELAHSSSARFCVVHLEKLDEALMRLEEQSFDVVLLDLSLPDSHGFETFEKFHDMAPEIPVVVLSGRADEELAVRAVQSGAQDYLVKGGMAEDVLARSIRYAIERHRGEQTLVESEVRYRLLIQHSPNVYLVHCGGEVVFANAASLKLFGAERLEQLLERHFLKYISPEYHDVVSKQVINVQTDGVNSPIEIACTRLDGTPVYVEANINAFIHEGRPAVQVVLYDLTERNRAERTLAESEERYRLLIERSPSPHMVHCDGKVVFVNKAAMQMFGADRMEQLLGRSFLATVAPDFHDIVSKRVGSIQSNGANPPLEIECVRLDGTTVCVEGNSNAFIHEGRPAVQVVLHDLTERKRAEERIREQASMLDHAHDAIIVRDIHTQRVTFWNQGAERLYGWSSAEALERDVGELVGMDQEASRSVTLQLLKAGESHGEHRQVTKDGKKVTISSHATLVRDAAGNPKSALVINIDITAQKNLEAQFLRAQRMESIGTLASGLSHDLNNILAPIMMSVEVLRQNLTPEQHEDIVSTIETSVERGSEIVRQVLTFGSGLEGAKSPLQLNSLVNELMKIMGQTFPKDIVIENSLEPDLWQVMGNSTQLHQILLNLCVNARDAMPDGGKLILQAANLELDASYASMIPDARPGSYVLLEAIDTGGGIPAAIIERIFDPFFTTKGLGKGTGLGLSTVLGIVKSHGGFLNVNSDPGVGTTFQIYLPAAEGLKRAPALPAYAAPPKGNGELVLVVDDEPAITDVARRILESHGYQVLHAADGIEALALFAKESDRIDIVLTDLMMPLLDGVALIRALRKLKPELKVIASTGLGEKQHLDKLKTTGVESVLHKPYGAGTLLRIIHDVLYGAAGTPIRRMGYTPHTNGGFKDVFSRDEY